MPHQPKTPVVAARRSGTGRRGAAPWIAGLAGLALLAGGCAPTVNSRGHVDVAPRLADIQPGVHTQADVESLLGSPTTVATFGEPVWYYIGQRTERTAFFSPDVVDQTVTVIRFDELGRVAAVERNDDARGKEIQIVDRETPTSGNSLTIWQQFFGNLGRFSTEDDGPRRTPRPY